MSLITLPRRLGRRATRLIPARARVIQEYTRVFGVPPDLETPKLLCEKLNWMKLNYLDPLMIDCTDKLLVRKYVKTATGTDLGVPVLQSDLRAEDIRPEVITPDTFVLKVNHDCGGVLVCRDRDRFDWAAARNFMARRLRYNYYWANREAAYWPLQPQIYVEECLPETPQEPLLDYKVHCFNGVPKIIQIILLEFCEQTGSRQKRQAFYAPDWMQLPIQRWYPTIKGEVPRPAALEELVDLARTLSAPFSMVRVDLFSPSGSNRLYVGELTFCPSAGLVRFAPDTFEREAGDWLTLPAPRDPWGVIRDWQTGQAAERFRP